MMKLVCQVQWTQVVLIMILAVTFAFAQEESALSIVSQPNEISIVQKDSSATLSCVAPKRIIQSG